MKIKFVVPGRPQGKQRPRMTKTGHVYTPQQTKDYEKHIQSCFINVKPAGWEPLSGPVMVTVQAYFEQARSNKMEYAMIKPDIDNVVKVALDAIQGNGGVIVDDKQVIGMVVEKFWGNPDRLEITVETIYENN